MQAKANLLRTLLVLPVVVLVALAVALFGLGLRAAETQTTTASTTTYYNVQDLGTLGDTRIYSRAESINDSGQVVGYSRRNDGSDHAFLYDSTNGMKDLSTLSGASSYAYDINNSGKVVGSSQGHAFIYDSTNGMKDLNDMIPEDYSGWKDSGWTIDHATAINSDGKIVVTDSWYGYGATSHLLTPVTTATPATYEVQSFPTVRNDYGTINATAINDPGKVVGTAGNCFGYWTEGGFCTEWHDTIFLYDSATQQMQDLYSYGSPTGINDSGKVVAGQRLYDSATQQWQDLGTVGGYSSSRALGINDSGTVVGAVCNTLHHEGTDGNWYYESCHASLKESAQPMIDLNTLIPPASGWTIEEATAINSDGKIAATGSKDGVGTHALLLTPTSEIPPPNITSPKTNTYDTDGSFSVSGSAIAGSTVELFEGTTSTGKTTKADSSSGAWSIALSGISTGAHTYSAKATKDAAGNTSAASNTVTVTVDKTAPTVSSVSPSSGATGVSLSPTVTATFSEEMDPNTLTTSTFTLTKQGSTTPITSTVSYDAKTATLKPSSTLATNTKYTATVKGGASGAKDKAGNALASNKVWSFTAKR